MMVMYTNSQKEYILVTYQIGIGIMFPLQRRNMNENDIYFDIKCIEDASG